MPTPEECMDVAAADMNDSAQTVYTDEALLPYFNMALSELVERMEEASLPTTDKVSLALTITAGVTSISYDTLPALPADLIEILELWESNNDGLSWTPLVRKDFIDPNIQNDQNLSYFGQYAWNEMHIQLPQATTDIDLKIWYTRKLSADVDIGSIAVNVPITNSKLFLGHKTGALAAILINQDPERATVLNQMAEEAIQRTMNIPMKSQQAVFTRRRPFRSAYKQLGRSW